MTYADESHGPPVIASSLDESFRLLVEQIRDYAIFMLDTDGRIRTWNLGAERIKGYSADEIIGQHFSRFYSAEDVAADKPGRGLADAIANGSVEDEGWRFRKDGSRFWANVTITAILGPSGQLHGFAKVTRDMTERRQADEIERRNRLLVETLRQRDDFLSIVSHELRTPLTALQLQIQTLVRHATTASSPPITADKLALIERQVQRLTKLVDEMLDVARINTGRLVLTMETVDLAEIARQVVARHQDAFDRASCQLTLAAPASLIGHWDPVRLDQVLTNLLSNALKFGSGHPVTITVATEADNAILIVTDQGIGIPTDDQERVFERFVRLSSPQHYGGFGLGLWLSRELVTAMGGTISLESAPDQGTSFRVELPLTSQAAIIAEAKTQAPRRS